MASLMFFNSVIKALCEIVGFGLRRKEISIDSVFKEQEHKGFTALAKSCLNLCSKEMGKTKTQSS